MQTQRGNDEPTDRPEQKRPFKLSPEELENVFRELSRLAAEERQERSEAREQRRAAK